ncbi:unnamed protein product [Pieris brassicae]|uniref:Uncharacterized protein n=1 Tax=Pieris brassicae TaxID=7116 RepID=A0A9P0TQU9_PIEBR|nr:unnamed protein product [Pieris brassicae]
MRSRRVTLKKVTTDHEHLQRRLASCPSFREWNAIFMKNLWVIAEGSAGHQVQHSETVSRLCGYRPRSIVVGGLVDWDAELWRLNICYGIGRR